jgi:hypothetical protein
MTLKGVYSKSTTLIDRFCAACVPVAAIAAIRRTVIMEY